MSSGIREGSALQNEALLRTGCSTGRIRRLLWRFQRAAVHRLHCSSGSRRRANHKSSVRKRSPFLLLFIGSRYGFSAGSLNVILPLVHTLALLRPRTLSGDVMSWGRDASAKRTLYCGVDDCGPEEGPRCANCAPFTIGIMPQKKPTKAPLCFKGHACKLSRHGENGETAPYRSGFCCDRCCGSSSRGHNGGNWERWFCPECSYDLCLVCCPKPGDGDLPHKVSSDDLNSPSLFARTGMPQLGMCRRIDAELGREGRAGRVPGYDALWPPFPSLGI